MILALGAGATASWFGKGASLGSEAGLVMPAPSAHPPMAEPVVPTPALPPLTRAPAVATSAEDRAEWEHFKRRFISGDGRVIDTGNGGVSHSEGQGWGMLFAVAFDDPTCFDSLLSWTRRCLARPDDTLHAWRYLPQAANKVPDLNNATDADLFIASALLRAARRWGRPDHAQAAAAIGRDVLRLLVRQAGPRLVLLPGAQGFAQPVRLTVNPSYYVFHVLDELATLVPSPLWARLHADGLTLLADARFGRWRLPPDWLQVDRDTGALSPHPNWPARFSYDAIRVPLYLAWGRGRTSAAAGSFAAYWSTRLPAPPAWVDLNTDASANYPAPPGMIAVAKFATAEAQSPGKIQLPGGFPALRASPDYYSAALILLSRLAWLESRMV